MILEIAFVEVLPENHAAFESAIRRAVSEVLSKSKGYVDFKLYKGVERADTYTFHIQWETLEDHTIGFRESDLFVQWRGIIGKYFANPPLVENWNPTG